MSSALAAFAKAQHGASAATEPHDVADDAYASDEEPPTERLITTTAPSALAAFAQAQSPPSQPQPSSKKTVTLMDIAKEQQSPSLVDVARTFNRQTDQAATAQLRAIAADVQAEATDAAQRRAREIERALVATSQQVKQEQQATRHEQVGTALRAASQDVEAASTAYNQHDDDFEADDADDPAVQRAADRVVEATATNKTSKRVGVATLSVDRHLLKQRQQRHGLDSKSTTKAKTLKDQLSAFQFDQLSLTQRRVFLAMLVDDKASRGTGAKKKCNMHAIEALAQDRATQLRQRQTLLKIKPPAYAKLDDARHCRFKPKIKHVDGGQRHDKDDDDDESSGGNQRREDFIRRMEATERVRTEQLRRTRAERDYLAQIDKKECPQCGNPQSYSELTQKRKKCPNCGVTYKSRLAWGEIADAFLGRMASHLETRLTPSSVPNSSNNQRQNAACRTRWCDVRDEFLGRVQLDLAQREMTKELIFQELEAQCTFAPQISDRARRLQLGDFDERLRRDLENRRLRQEQYRILSAAIAKAEASTSVTSKGKAAAPAYPRHKPTTKTTGLPASFAERLRKDLEQRRDRLAANEQPRVVAGSRGRSRGLY